ncbi:Ribonuclease VapC1 [Dictyocoela muelleri]|nr:Ribonuclease VapC1 [Dictyocoela muelleri]
MITIADTSAIIDKQLSMNDEIIISPSVYQEIKDTRLIEYLKNFNYKIIDPDNSVKVFVGNVADKNNLLLSNADIDVVALTYQYFSSNFDRWISKDQSIRCLTLDKGILQLLNILDISKYPQREFIFRCFSCFTLYKKNSDFCKKCGYATVTRVSINREDGMKLMLKKNFKYKEKIVKDIYGNVIKCAGERAYTRNKK